MAPAFGVEANLLATSRVSAHLLVFLRRDIRAIALWDGRGGNRCRILVRCLRAIHAPHLGGLGGCGWMGGFLWRAWRNFAGRGGLRRRRFTRGTGGARCGAVKVF